MSEHQQIAALEERLRLAEDAIEKLEDDIFTLRSVIDMSIRNSIKLTDAIEKLAMLVNTQQSTIESLQKLLEVGNGRK